jgi:hypothetical protein
MAARTYTPEEKLKIVLEGDEEHHISGGSVREI